MTNCSRSDPTPVVALNRAVAVAEVQGPALALAALEPLADQLADYHPFHVTRADFLCRLGRVDEARRAYDAALATVGNEQERAHIQRRRATLEA